MTSDPRQLVGVASVAALAEEQNVASLVCATFSRKQKALRLKISHNCCSWVNANQPTSMQNLRKRLRTNDDINLNAKRKITFVKDRLRHFPVRGWLAGYVILKFRYQKVTF